MAGTLDFFNNSYSSDEIKDQAPFFTLRSKSAQELLVWLKQEVQNRKKYHDPFFRLCQSNLAAYKGDYYKRSRQSDNLERLPMPQTSKYCVNMIYELTENMVSRMTRLKPATEVLPANDEFEDKNSARSVKLLLDHLHYINSLDLLYQKRHRHKLIFGESWLKIAWNKNLGDLHPAYITLRNRNFLDDFGQPINIDKMPIKIGDVEYKAVLPWSLLMETSCEYDSSRTLIEEEYLHIEEMKILYPDFANKFKASSSQEFSINSLRNESRGNCVARYTLYQKHDEYYPEGRKVIFTDDFVIEDGILGYSHGKFPFHRLTDIDVPGMLHGMSRYQQALILQNAHNNLSQSFMKSYFLMSAPKWIVPKKSVNIEHLGNGKTIVQYQGPTAPQLVTHSPIPPNQFDFRERIGQELGRIFGVHPVSTGQPPAGITAGIALQFLNEQENERSISDITKHNEMIVDVDKLSISVCGDNYKPDDGRMLRIVGKEGKHLVKYFDAANLSKDYDIRIQNSSALPQSKSAKLETIIQTMQYSPTLFTPERWSELLEFGSTEKMYTLITEAINSAESENEDLLEGMFVQDPQDYEDLITHLQVHYKKMQARSFKEEVPQDRREAFISHVLATEMLAADKAKTNQLFASKLAQLEQYPMFWIPDEMPASAAHQEAMVQGQANRGEAVTSQIPAQPLADPTQQTTDSSGGLAK